VEAVYSSTLFIAEFACTLHRGVREKVITRDHAAYLRQTFSGDSSQGVVQLIPISEGILRAVEATVTRMPETVFLRAGDAVHLASAQLEGFAEIWSNDRHMLKAAPHFGITGRSI
jgi:predicted nucleic acid-binding protein